MDETISFFLDPYRFIGTKCRKLNKKAFESRLFFQKTIFLSGKEAAEKIFYNPELVKRESAPPEMVVATLLGKGGVQSLDGEAHRHRKAMFVAIINHENVRALGETVRAVWEEKIHDWSGMALVKLYPELQEILAISACEWAGVPLKSEEIKSRTKELTAMFDAAGSKGIRHLWALLSSKEAEKWAMKNLQELRDKKIHNTPAGIIAHYTEPDGRVLDQRIAAVELLNLIRPTIACSVFMIFVAHALHLNPFARIRLQRKEEGFAEKFIQEIRRLYPFFPNMMARVSKDFVWNDLHFKKGERIVLDLYGTDHDPQVWKNPDLFNPDRFNSENITLFNFVPQGGGDPRIHHRCPGEPITIELMKIAIEFFVFRMKYHVPDQDLSINWQRLPGIVHDNFIIDKVIPVSKQER